MNKNSKIVFCIFAEMIVSQVMIRLKQICDEKGISIHEVAKKMGITPSAIYMMVNGNPTLKKMQDLAAAVDVEIQDLFTGNVKVKNPHVVKGYLECDGVIFRINNKSDVLDFVELMNKYKEEKVSNSEDFINRNVLRPDELVDSEGILEYTVEILLDKKKKKTVAKVQSYFEVISVIDVEIMKFPYSAYKKKKIVNFFKSFPDGTKDAEDFIRLLEKGVTYLFDNTEEFQYYGIGVVGKRI